MRSHLTQLLGRTQQFSLYTDGSLWARYASGRETPLGPVRSAWDPREFPHAASEWSALVALYASYANSDGVRAVRKPCVSGRA
ncbi:hypothetical protein ACYOEI_23015 [Singulisphaera rosea]